MKLSFIAYAAAVMVVPTAANAAWIETRAKAGYACCAQGEEQDKYDYTSTGLSLATEAHFTGDYFGELVSSDAYARANVETGEVGAYSASHFFGTATSRGLYSENLQFSIAGAGEDSVTPVTFLFKWHGAIESGLSPRSGTAMASWRFEVVQNNGSNYAAVGVDASSSNGAPISFSTINTGWSSYFDAGSTNDTKYFEVTYGLKGAAPSLSISNYVATHSYLTGSADAYHTAALNIILPENVTFSSSSGAFLSKAQAIVIPGSVPEPSTWMSMILGFLLIGATLRRDQKGLSLNACRLPA